MIKKVLLIQPPVTRPLDMLADKVRIGIVPPLGLGYIAAVLEQHNIEVNILDCVIEGEHQNSTHIQGVRYGLTDWQIQEYLINYQPDLVGVSCLTSNMAWDAHNVCQIVKYINPEIITVMGGTHPTVRTTETLADDNVDYVAAGEGEKSLLSEAFGANIKAYHPSPITNLDSLPFPARHLLPMDKYFNTNSPHSGVKRRPFTSMITSRGCLGRCSFCTIREMWGEKYRFRSPENVLAEIEQLVNTYGIKEIHFEDDNFTANKKRAMAILQGIIDHKWNLSLNSPSGLAVFALDEQLLEKMAEAGYYSISLAIESGSEWVRKELMHKHVDIPKTKCLAKKARELGMKVKGFFILGYPGETKETMKETVEVAGSLGLDWAIFFPATPLPGTEMEAICRKNNWLVNPNLDYMHSFYKANIKTPEFDPEYVEAFREESNFKVNFEHNYNMETGAYDRAMKDFQEVVDLYPNLQFAQEYLEKAKKCAY